MIDPIEETDPELAALLADWIENKRYERYRIEPGGYRRRTAFGYSQLVSVRLDIGRNDPCPVCNSNRKFKHCCGK